MVIQEDEGNVENTSSRRVFSTFLECSQITGMFYHSVIHSLGFFICFNIQNLHAQNNKTRLSYVLYSDKTWVFDQSERAQGPIYILKYYINETSRFVYLWRIDYDKCMEHSIRSGLDTNLAQKTKNGLPCAILLPPHLFF